jgi:microcin C transport system substrate-binding protein
MKHLLRSLLCCLALALPGMPAALAAHAYAQFGDIKYPAGFDHFDWANPAAPKGGTLRMTTNSTDTSFEKYNPFTLKGSAAPGLISADGSIYGNIMFESLLTTTMDEPATGYGLLADDVTVAPDKLSASFHINPKAHFQDGSPVLAQDVKYSFDRLSSAEAWPLVRSQLSDIKQVVVLDERRVRFDFRSPGADLPLVAGSMAVFSHKWGAGKRFDEVITDMPIASGPYKIGRVDFGREITYERDRNYWARDLNVRRGLYNFDRINYRLYKDTTAQTEAFMAGEFDFIQVFISREWNRRYKGPKFDSGSIVKKLFPMGGVGNFQSFMLNTRRDKFKDIRVRRAIGLAMDYEWMNRQLFFNAYTRMNSFFAASDYEAKGLPDAAELAVLEPLRSKLRPEVFTEPAPLQPTTAPPNSLRDNLRQARALLAEAGWTYRDGALRNAKGEVFSIEFLDESLAHGRYTTPFMQALGKLGIETTFKVGDFASVKRRYDAYDFDIASLSLEGYNTPGKELPDRYGSKAAATEGTYNYAGVSDPAVDALIELVQEAHARPEYVTRLRALDRVLRHGYYIVPHWFASNFRSAYRGGKFAYPAVAPRYYMVDSWVITAWWQDPKAGAH